MNSPAAPLLTELLQQVSRSFYLTLRFLPGAVRPQISLAYLLARATDTIADTALVPLDRRLDTLRQLRLRLQGRPTPLQLGAFAAVQHETAERVLLERLNEALALLDSLDTADQARIRQVLDIITSGQELDLVRFGCASGSAIVALPDDSALEDYTYRVAGCVGEFWTRMCLAHLYSPKELSSGDGPPGVRPAVKTVEGYEQLGVRFGQGLQLVNILRDLPRDLRQGRCYLPLEGLRELGLQPNDLLDPANESRVRPLYNALLNRAHDHLAAGWRYTNAIPLRWCRMRLACAWPVLIGVRTLGLLRSCNPLDPARRHKVSRGAVRAILVRSVLMYPLPVLWRELWREAGGLEMRG